jgi:amidophosphoribosyltransferase
MSPEDEGLGLDDKFHDECGLFGAWNHAEAANLAYLGLYALQHRGQESAGIAATDGHAFHVEKGMGWVADVFSRDRLRRLPGHRAIGHVRYSTAGSSNLRNAQPITATTSHGPVAIAHNGNLINAEELRRQLEADGAVFQSSSDTEVILHLLARAEGGTLVDQLARALNQVKGAYTLLLLTPTCMITVRDPSGFRPMTLGRLDDSWILASETCALDLMEAEVVRDLEPGELVVVDDAGLQSYKPFRPQPKLQCVFEYVYFARPDSVLWGRNVHAVRKALGHQLAREHPVTADLVIPVPDSGVGAALGYAEEAGLPYDSGLVRNHYVGRTFIDDSIVRGTTSRKIVKMVRAAGAREVHMRISSPPIQWPCYYGIDTPTRKELIGSSHEVKEIERYLAADSLGYLSLDGMLKAAGNDPGHFCHACFTGQYQIGFDAGDIAQLKLFES